MRKLIYFIILFYPSILPSIEKTKEEKVAKFVLENIQKDYTTCYGFYKIASESFKKANAKKSITKGLDESADITLKFSHDLGEVLNYKPKFMADNNKKRIKELTTIAKKDFNQLTKKYGVLCKKLVENQKQRIDYWENQGNKKIK
ncbi:hypothetical protein OAS21_00110 [Pelagibacteraceae bacterium]|nr:hypothetical protein [Pelagibacteraceae bacterium]|tara:strand:+ start:79 stop:513 length:435 start_codon:yes stop_codon:yes gene_type:complete